MAEKKYTKEDFKYMNDNGFLNAKGKDMLIQLLEEEQ